MHQLGESNMPLPQKIRFDGEIEKLEAAHRAALAAGNNEGAKMIGAEIARHAIQQHHGLRERRG